MGLHLVGIGDNGNLWHTIRNDDGNWQPSFGVVESVVSGGPAGFTAVACGSDDGQVLQVVGVGSDGKLWHTLRDANGNWQTTFGEVESVVSGGPATFIAVGCAGAAGVLQVVGVGSDGKLWHTLRHDNGNWQTTFGEVESVVSGGPATFTSVACGSDDGQVLQVVGVGNDGKLWHTLRNPDSQWQASFGEIEKQVSGGAASYAAVGCAGAAGALQVVGLGSGGFLWHTLRHDNGNWQATFEEVESLVSGGANIYVAVACGSDDGQVLQVAGVGSGHLLWHTLRNPNGNWQTSFGEVESVVSDGPAFVGIGAAAGADYAEPPPAPSWANPALTNLTETSVILHWQSVPTAQGFFVDAVNIATGTAEFGANPGAGSTSCFVDDLTPDRTYKCSLGYEASGRWSAKATLEVHTIKPPPPPLIVVPFLVGLTLTQALAALDKVGLQLGTLINPTGQIENNLLKVVSQDPQPPTRIPVGSSVNLAVTAITQTVAGYSQVQVMNANGDGQPVEVWLLNLSTGARSDVGTVDMNAQQTFPLENGASFEIVAVDVTRSGCNGDPTTFDCQAGTGFVTGMTGGPTYPFQVL